MQQFKNILVFIGTRDQKPALDRAFEIASENGAKVTLMDVIKPLPDAIGKMTDVASPEDLERLLVQDRERQLQEIADGYSDAGVETGAIVSSGDAAREICRRVLTGGHDLVLKTADGGHSGGGLFSSTAKSLLRICPCPVWIMKPRAHGDFDQVLAAIDVDDIDETHRRLNRFILELAFSIAQRDDAQLHIVSAWDLWMEQALRRRAGDAEIDAALEKHEGLVQRALDELLQAPFAKDDRVTVHLKRGVASRVIKSVADEVEADLIVMGTVCRTGVAGFLIGNTAENLIANATSSVLAIKPEGFRSPLEDEVADETTSVP